MATNNIDPLNVATDGHLSSATSKATLGFFSELTNKILSGIKRIAARMPQRFISNKRF